MSGEKNLNRLLQSIKPVLNNGEYVFCTTNDISTIVPEKVVSVFKEKEGYTLILEKTLADNLKLNYSYIASWITLSVHSSLEAIGLTAAFSNALAKHKISCNVIAGFYHDHIFVDKDKAEIAMAVLKELANIEQ